MTPSTITVTEQDKGSTLQDFLARRLHLSRNAAKDAINARKVFVNRRCVWMARHILRTNDEVALAPQNPAPSRRKLTILFDADGILVVNKPAGMLANGPGGAEDILRGTRRDAAVCCAHRLDRDTTGCLMLTTADAAHAYALSLFRDRTVTKIYHAIVLGYVADREQTISAPIEGEAAVTHVRVLDANRDASHVALRIDTGRTHQIRRHMAGLQHAVIGDRHYGPRGRATDKSMRIGRQMLHAYALQWPDPDANRRACRATAPLPQDFRRCLAMYRLS